MIFLNYNTFYKSKTLYKKVLMIYMETKLDSRRKPCLTYRKYNANTNKQTDLYFPCVDGNGTPCFVNHQMDTMKIRLRQSKKSLET